MSGQELYHEMQTHLMEDEAPSEFLKESYEDPQFRQYPFEMLRNLKRAQQSPEHHPEGNVWNHTMLVVDEAAKVKNKSRNPTVFMWAALLHDLGKPATTKIRNGKITSYDHDKVGAKLAKDFLSQFSKDERFINEVCALVRYHMQILFVVKGTRFAEIQRMKQNTDVREIALLGLCDRLGRTNPDRSKEERNIEQFLHRCVPE